MDLVIKLKQDITPQCPVCGHNLDAHQPTEGEGIQIPTTGDVSICLNCISTLIYEVTDRIDLRLPTEEEQLELDKDEHIQKVKQMMILVKYGKQGLS